jgi:DNA-binding NtrC family response regulator
MAAGESQITEQHLSDDFLDDVRRGPAPSPARATQAGEPNAAPQALEMAAQPAMPGPLRETADAPPGLSAPAAEAVGERETDGSTARTLGEAEIEMIRATLAAANGNISEASKRLGISRNTIYRKLRWGKPA